MKSNRIILTVILLLTLVFLGQPAITQEKTKEEKELELQKAIDLQKKAMAEEKKQQELQMKEQEKALFELQKSLSESDGVNNYYRIGRSRSTGGNWNGSEPFVVTPGVDMPPIAVYGRYGGDNERTTWDFSKNVKESTFSKQYSFDVEKSASNVVMSVLGDCKSGEIRVKIIMPGGKTYSDILLDEFGNLNWRKSFTISETENKEKAGEWIFKIDATKASGYFKISLQTY